MNNRKPYHPTDRHCAQSGYTILELLVVLVLSSIVFAGLSYQLSSSVTAARDHQIRLETFVQAQAVVQTIGAELRMAGNGVPFDQANFQIGQIDLSDTTVTEPILVASATQNSISFRLNETGEVFVLTSSFDPSSSLTLALSSTEQLEENDPIYISNSTVSGDEGLYGVIASVSQADNTVTLASNPITTIGAVFPVGSILEEVPVVRYNSPETGSGITRNTGFGDVLLAPNSRLSLEYLDHTGSPMTLPLSTADLVDTLRSIRATVTMTSTRKLTTNEPHTVSVTQTVGIRNLNYFF